MTYESNEKKARRARALGVVVATAVVTMPTLSCSSETETTSTTNGATDSGATEDTGTSTDAALAMETGTTPDAGSIGADAGSDAEDIDDAYPYGVRG